MKELFILPLNFLSFHFWGGKRMERKKKERKKNEMSEEGKFEECSASFSTLVHPTNGSYWKGRQEIRMEGMSGARPFISCGKGGNDSPIAFTSLAVIPSATTNKQNVFLFNLLPILTDKKWIIQ